MTVKTPSDGAFVEPKTGDMTGDMTGDRFMTGTKKPVIYINLIQFLVPYFFYYYLSLWVQLIGP